MRKARRIAGHLAAALVGAIAGGTIVLAIDGATRDLGPRRQASAPTPFVEPSGSVAPTDPAGEVLLAWSPGGLPARTERGLEKLRGVQHATTVRAGLDWIKFSRANDGSIIDNPGGGRAIPFEVAVIEPREYAEYVAPSERDAVLALEHGEVLLAETAADIRGAGRGLSIRMQSGNVDVDDVVSDVATNGYEGLLAGDIWRVWPRVDRFVLMKVGPRADRHAIQRKLQSLLDPDQRLRIRAQGEVPFLRYGDAVLPQLVIKQHFGEFSASPGPGGSISVDPRWRNKNIVARDVPVLGTVTCHRGIFPQLRDAMGALRDEGLAFTVDTADFGGCFSPRFIDANPDGRLSHHSWGIAFDINVSTNRAGTRADQDPRLVEVMEEAGFSWGGRWLIPDGMHFEWVRFP
ncbi:MAG: M15 family metallopeptidase [Actinomycetota bacterium]|nr:M15 family metallopeptidase [Actinomycetota bacterium]